MVQTPRLTPIPRREISGAASIVVPFTEAQEPDWQRFVEHVARVADAGITPAISMLMDSPAMLSTELQVGAIYQAEAAVHGSRFYAGVHVFDQPGDWFNADRYARQAEVVVKHGGVPVFLPSYGSASLDDGDWLKAMRTFGNQFGQFIVGDISPDRVPSGDMRSSDAYVALLRNKNCIGVAHGGLSRITEADRLRGHLGLRADFELFSLNERAIDMAIYGSSYMLFAAAMAPEHFARRDAMWADAARGFYDLNDTLQYLARFTSRTPTNAQAHSVLQFMKLRGWASCTQMPDGCPKRPDSDVNILLDIAEQLGIEIG